MVAHYFEGIYNGFMVRLGARQGRWFESNWSNQKQRRALSALTMPATCHESFGGRSMCGGIHVGGPAHRPFQKKDNILRTFDATFWLLAPTLYHSSWLPSNSQVWIFLFFFIFSNFFFFKFNKFFTARNGSNFRLQW